jgi:2-oxoglutarate ferredoxin oxidoreductase subunit delta
MARLQETLPTIAEIEIRTMKGYIEINNDVCKGCEICIAFCPKKAISSSGKLNPAGYIYAAFTGKEECTGCATCAVVCPDVAIEVYRG